MGYLMLRHNSRLGFDPSYPNIDHSNFWKCDWTDFYEGAVEAIPPNGPPPRERGGSTNVHRQQSCWQQMD